MANHVVYFIKETNGNWNFSRTYGKNKILSSHGQGYSRQSDCKKSYNRNCLKGATEKFVTRAEFKKLFPDKKKSGSGISDVAVF